MALPRAVGGDVDRDHTGRLINVAHVRRIRLARVWALPLLGLLPLLAPLGAEARRACKTDGLVVRSLTASGTTCKTARSVAAQASTPLAAGGCAFPRNGVVSIKVPCVRLRYHCKPLFHSASLGGYYVRCRKSDSVAIHFLF